jgi:hypothetical protein
MLQDLLIRLFLPIAGQGLDFGMKNYSFLSAIFPAKPNSIVADVAPTPHHTQEDLLSNNFT